jgi:beta-aspartyl-peptidase (threonine type)
VVCEETPHVLVSGANAVELAADYGVETAADLWTDRTRERFDEVDAPVDAGAREQLAWLAGHFGRTDPDGRDEHDSAERGSAGRNPHEHDTVGAVAREGDRIAAATSTGGRWLALAGRVGDVPQVGSGFYCNPAAGASATGAGEDIARVTLSRRAVRHVEAGWDAEAAAGLAIEEFGELTGSSAGIIVLDADGDAGSAFNSEGMQTAVARN